MKHITSASLITLTTLLTGCIVCNDPEPATIVHVVDADWDSNDYTIVEFSDGSRFGRPRQWGSVGDELTACRCQSEGKQWWRSPNVNRQTIKEAGYDQ